MVVPEKRHSHIPLKKFKLLFKSTDYFSEDLNSSWRFL